MYVDVQMINDKVRESSSFVEKVYDSMRKVIVGQKSLLDRMLIGMLADGHILLEGVPGLAKTTAALTLAKSINADFKRIQFTPDLLPADLIGTLIFQPGQNTFTTRKGPIFANFILADEINRSPAKVQSALLESMQERQGTIGNETFKLPVPFMVLATENPIEQEGTYPLPEAQVDRFMLKVVIDYPAEEEEKEIINRMTSKHIPEVEAVIELDEIIKAREIVKDVYVDEKIKNYIINLVFATRDPKKYNLDIAPFIQYGASPRASIYLVKAAQAHAFIKHRGYVIPEDIKQIGMDVLRHRVIPSFEAEAEEKTSEDIIKTIFDTVEVP